MRKIQKPKEGEYAPYAIMYIDLLPDDGLVLKHLQDNLTTIQTFIPSFTHRILISASPLPSWWSGVHKSTFTPISPKLVSN